MSDIAASVLGAKLAGGILALKLSLQQDQAAVALVEKALESPQNAQQAAPETPASNRLVDVVV